MSKTKSGYKAYFPDDDQGPEDAVDIEHYHWNRFFDAEDAAEAACEHDFHGRDGWERSMAGGETAHFPIVVIGPDGTETRFRAWHEASVEHRARVDDGDEVDRNGLQAGEGVGRQDEAGAGQQSEDGQAGCLDPAESPAQGEGEDHL